MKRFIPLFILLPAFAFPVSVTETVHTMVEDLGQAYTLFRAEDPFYSRQTVSILEIRNASKEAADNYVGEAIEELLKEALHESIVFRFVDRRALDTAMEEITLSLSGLTEEGDELELGKIRGLRLLLDGSVTAEKENFLLNLRLVDIETTEVVASLSKAVPKEEMIEVGAQMAYEYVTANGIGLSFFATPSRHLLLPQAEAVAVGDDKIHAGSGGGRLTYRLGRNWKISLNMDSKYHDVFFDKRNIGDMKNLTSVDDVFADLDILGFWQEDGSLDVSFEENGDEDDQVRAELDARTNYYTLSQFTSTASIAVSYVHSFSRKANISFGAGPHVNWVQLRQNYDNAPILINQGIAFKRYEVTMDFLGLGATAALDFEYFVLPRFALNAGCTYLAGFIFPRKELDAKSPTTGEYYYTDSDFAIESFGLNPFMMPDGREISGSIYSPAYFKVYFGVSVYF
ncbi:MAG: CsgG/HfaB family protein [Spirochaetia bacterium]